MTITEELKCALGRTIIQLAVLNVRYCGDDPGIVKDLQAIESWMNKQKSEGGLASPPLLPA